MNNFWSPLQARLRQWWNRHRSAGRPYQGKHRYGHMRPKNERLVRNRKRKAERQAKRKARLHAQGRKHRV